MDTPPDAREKIAPQSIIRPSIDLLVLAIIVVQIIVAVYGFAVLPETIPIHWGLNGQADGYGPRWLGTLLYPLMSAGIFILIRALLAAGPRLGGRDATAANLFIGKLVIVGIALLLLIIQLSTLALALGVGFDITLVITLALSLFFLFLGNYMGKIRRNFWMGIRTPWSIANEVVWERTHRIGGWLFVAVGIIGIPCSFIPALRLWGIIGPLLAVCVFLYGYSYVCYQRVTQEESEALSPPFERDNQET
jgi:uncharacterized membrane protein